MAFIKRRAYAREMMSCHCSQEEEVRVDTPLCGVILLSRGHARRGVFGPSILTRNRPGDESRTPHDAGPSSPPDRILVDDRCRRSSHAVPTAMPVEASLLW